MLNPHQLPTLRVLVPLVVGILTAYYMDVGWTFPALILVLSFISLIATSLTKSIFKTETQAKVSAFLFFLSLGYWVCWSKQELNDPLHFSHQELGKGTKYICQVQNSPHIEEDWIVLESSVNYLIRGDSQKVSASGNVLVYLERDDHSEQVTYGDLLLLTNPPQRVRKNTNPDAFDYSRYLHFRNIHHRVFAKAGSWKIIETRNGNPILAFAFASQNHLVNVLRKYLTTSDEFAVGSALLLGYREEIPQTLKEAYSQTGAMHVLAVSGLHVGIVFILLSFAFKRLRTSSKIFLFAKTVYIVLGIWLFALITGAAPSTMRAATMFSLLAIGMGLNRSGNIYNTLMLSAILLLMINPLWLANVGFQLSYLAVFGIVYFQRKMERMIYVPKGILRKIWALITVSFAAQLTTGPISIFYFRQFPVFFWLSSLFLVPAAALLMTGGLLLIFFDWFDPGIAVFIGKALWGAIWLCNQIVYQIQDMPGALINDLYISKMQTYFLYLILAVVLIFISHKHKGALMTGAALSMLFVASTSFTSISTSKKFELVVYDKYKSSVIECYHDQKCYRLNPNSEAEHGLEFTVKGHHQRMGIRKIYNLSEENIIEPEKRLVKKGDKIAFGGRRILHIQHRNTMLELDAPVQIDWIIVSNNAFAQLEKGLSLLHCKKVIFDTSNNPWLVKKWVQVLTQQGIGYHVVSQSGAFQIDW